MPSVLPALAESRPLRFSAFTLLYVAQGIPLGLLDVAMPAWLAEQGYSATQVGSYVAFVGLPWAFKLVMGPFMDRFGIPAMGRRRPWVMIAQTGLMLMLAMLALIPDPSTQLALIMACGFAVNCFAATQDVAVDGMAIDVLPIAERGRANAFMAFGQVIGMAGMGALSGGLLRDYGLITTALVAGAAVGVILILVVLTRERQGERILPWTSGKAHPHSKGLAPTLFGLFGDLKRVLILRQSLMITSAVLTVRLAAGMFIACAPVFAVQKLGHSAASYSESYGLLSGAAALLGLAAGPLVDRLGAKKVMLIALCCGAVLQLSFGLMESAWSTTWFVLVMLGVYLLVEQVIFIGMIAQYMNLTWEKVAATQFAVYMALTNLGRSAGSAVFASTVAFVDFQTLFLGMGSLMLVSAFLLQFFNQQRHLDNLTQLSRPSPGPSQP